MRRSRFRSDRGWLHYRYVVDAYWYAVQGRFEDAAAALAKAGEFETVPDGGFLGTSIGMGALPAVVRTYQAQGREHEAQAMVLRFQDKVRKERGARPPDVTQNVLLAEIALAAGQRTKAVRHLQAAMTQAPVPPRLHPQLPWFKTLEGEPGYAQLVDELAERQAAMRAQGAALDAAPDSPALVTWSGPGNPRELHSRAARQAVAAFFLRVVRGFFLGRLRSRLLRSLLGLRAAFSAGAAFFLRARGYFRLRPTRPRQRPPTRPAPSAPSARNPRARIAMCRMRV